MRCLIIVWFCLFIIPAAAQKVVPPLEREVSIQVNNETAAFVLEKLAQQTGIKFSYSPTKIQADKKVTFKVVNKPLRTVLLLVFADAVTLKEKGNFVIITAKSQVTPQMVVKELVFNGYVYDENGEKLAYASIINKKEQTAAVTNQYGYYSIKVTSNQLPLDLKVVKEDYNDTLIKINASQKQVDVVLKKELPPVVHFLPSSNDTINTMVQTDTSQVEVSSLDSGVTQGFGGLRKALSKFSLSTADNINIKNLKDTLFTNVQLSVIPQLSTNKLLVGNTVNKVSVSLLWGYSKGVNATSVSGLMDYSSGNVQYAQVTGLINAVEGNVKGAQVAGIINLVDGNVHGGEVAGIINVVGGNVRGGQVGGILNLVDSNVRGTQVAGIMNVVGGKVDGIQAGGIGNVTVGDVEGIQAAGLFNVTEGFVEGGQIAGLVNVNGKGSSNFQIAGLCNISEGDMSGIQISALVNVTEKKLSGAQISGFCNINDSVVSGVQVAGLFNAAKTVNGTQISLFNFANENNGTSIGLLSFTRKGYNKIELFGHDAMYTNLALRLGVQHFHNVFIAGVDLTNRVSGLWSLGYGFGSYFNLNDKWKLGGDLTAQFYIKGNEFSKAPHINHLFIGFDRRITNKMSCSFGPVFNVMVSYSNTDKNISDMLSSYSMLSESYSNGTQVKAWIGAKVTFKFL
jgi:hypothetical protein